MTALLEAARKTVSAPPGLKRNRFSYPYPEKAAGPSAYSPQDRATSTGRRLLARGPPAAMYMMKVASCSPNLRRFGSGPQSENGRGGGFSL